MSLYNKPRGALGAFPIATAASAITAANYDPFKGGLATDFDWMPGLPSSARMPGSQYGCGSRKTGQPYSGGPANFPCKGKPPASSGGGAAWEFLKNTFLPQTTYPGNDKEEASITASSLFIPAVVAIGVVGLLLIMKKKK